MCKASGKKGLKILNFNVEGLSSELDDPSFIELMHQHDICLLNETWKVDDSKIGLPGFWDFSQVRNKLTKKGRPSGGVTVFCKNEIRKGIRIASHTEGFIWLKMDSKFFNLATPLFIGASYIPPEYSKRKSSIKIDYFKELAKSLARYTEKGNVILVGDMNSRTGNNCVSEIRIPGLSELFLDDKASIKDRTSCDITVNNYGKKLNRLCKEYDLVIANGRTPGDRIGNFTCHTSRGDSVVDYFISDHSFFNRLKKLVVHEPVFGSVHSP